MVYFFHHYELPAVLNQHRQLARIRANRNAFATPATATADSHNADASNSHNVNPTSGVETQQEQTVGSENTEDPVDTVPVATTLLSDAVAAASVVASQPENAACHIQGDVTQSSNVPAENSKSIDQVTTQSSLPECAEPLKEETSISVEKEANLSSVEANQTLFEDSTAAADEKEKEGESNCEDDLVDGFASKTDVTSDLE